MIHVFCAGFAQAAYILEPVIKATTAVNTTSTSSKTATDNMTTAASTSQQTASANDSQNTAAEDKSSNQKGKGDAENQKRKELCDAYVHIRTAYAACLVNAAIASFKLKDYTETAEVGTNATKDAHFGVTSHTLQSSVVVV